MLAELLAACPRLHFLATSRSPLRLQAERVFAVGPLVQNEAALLFLERARQHAPAVEIHVELAEQIARRLAAFRSRWN